MTLAFLTGLLGSLALVSGAAWPESKDHHNARKSVKNWLFAIGSFIMFIYAILGYIAGGPVFFVILEIMVMIAITLMMLNTSDKVDIRVIGTSGAALTIWSLFLFKDYTTIFFIVGLITTALGYALEMATVRRNLALALGSILIALFSYLESSWIFFWLNVFFAIFSAYYLVKSLKIKHKK